jgi:asparagine synthase (glutamine-hydrolysing)
MSGIVGIYYPDRRLIRPKKLQVMLDILDHRGSDAVDIWYRGNIGFGQRMLWTTPESLLEKLPLEDKTRQLTITADARIDNREELISLLELKYLPTEKITDSQIVLVAYQKWGEDCPQKLIGDFAFAIWDEREQKLFCARDPMGIKPFYYYYTPGLFAFASEIKALFTQPEIPQQLNELRIAYQLAAFFEDKEITFYRDIYRLPAAHCLTVSSKGKQIKRYWALDPHRRIKLSSDREYTEAFKELFVESVKCRLRSAFPVGSTLSGGLDSSSITCTARNLLAGSGKQLHTFSAIFPSLPESDLRFIDERYYMNRVKAAGKIEAHDVRADLLDPMLDYLWQEEEPILSPNIYIHEGMYNDARRNGVRVFLDGVDGDSTISHGWRYLTALTYTGNWYRLYKEITATAKNMRISRKLIAQKYCLDPFFAEPLEYIKQQFLPNRYYGELIDPAFARRINLAQRIQALCPKPLFLTAREEHRSGLATGLYSYAMEITDRATSDKSLEARYPFFDRRLMEFCLAIPLEQKFRQGYPRAILRHGMTGILPTEIQWRVSKSRLGSNFQRNFLTYQRSTIEKVISHSKKITPYMNIPNLNSIYHRYVIQKRPESGDDLSLLNTVLLSLWLERI